MLKNRHFISQNVNPKMQSRLVQTDFDELGSESAEIAKK